MDRHLFFDRALHSNEADAELILEQLTDRSHTSISEMIDVVGFADTLAHLEHIANHIDKITRRQGLLIQAITLRFAEFYVCFQPAHAREVELALIKEHSAEQVPGGEDRWRITGPHLSIDLEDGIARRLNRVLLERLADHDSNIVALRK